MRESSPHLIPQENPLAAPRPDLAPALSPYSRRFYPQVLTAQDFGHVSRHPRPQTLCHEDYTDDSKKKLRRGSHDTAGVRSRVIAHLPMRLSAIASALGARLENGSPNTEIRWRVAQACVPDSRFPFRNSGCPVLAFFARAGTMLPIVWIRDAHRTPSYLRRSSPALYHRFLLPANFRRLNTGGERGIRTPDTRKGIHAFEARAFSHSAISPRPPVSLYFIREAVGFKFPHPSHCCCCCS
jgi:hypothetical protein